MPWKGDQLIPESDMSPIPCDGCGHTHFEYKQLQDKFFLAGAWYYERRIEWLEGLAKYIELAIWREASASSDYAPLPVLTDDPDFKKYASFAQRWSQELDQMKRQATLEGDIRFYYTGMAQAMLLDQLMPGWKARALTESMTVEDLLREALQQPHPMVTASRARTRQRK